jgi:hypothetical protein
MKDRHAWGLKESIGAMGLTAKYFQYDSDDEDWYEAATFCVSTPEPHNDTVLVINFFKLTKTSGEFEVVMRYFQDDEWVSIEYSPFKEVPELYSGVAFNVYLQGHCLSKMMFLLTEESERLASDHIEAIEEAVDTLKVYIETAISMIEATPSLKNSNIPGMIEKVYKRYELKGTFGEDVFPN